MRTTSSSPLFSRLWLKWDGMEICLINSIGLERRRRGERNSAFLPLARILRNTWSTVVAWGMCRVITVLNRCKVGQKTPHSLRTRTCSKAIGKATYAHACQGRKIQNYSSRSSLIKIKPGTPVYFRSLCILFFGIYVLYINWYHSSIPYIWH